MTDTAAPSPLPPPPRTATTLDELIEVIHRLGEAFSLAASTLTSNLPGTIWIVHGPVGDLPTVEQVLSMDDLCALIHRKRLEQNREDSGVYFMHIFYGQRWLLQKGRVWHVWDGKTMHEVASADVEEFIDQSGVFSAVVDLDNVIPTPTAPPHLHPPEETPPVPESVDAISRATVGEADDDESDEPTVEPD